MPWQPLPRIAFAVATYPFKPSSPADLPLEIGDELYVIEETPDGNWLRGYLVAPPSLLAGLTSVKGQTLEARVFSGIFPRSCVEVREMLGESDDTDEDEDENNENRPRDAGGENATESGSESSVADGVNGERRMAGRANGSTTKARGRRRPLDSSPNGIQGKLSIPVKRDPAMPPPPAPKPFLKVGDETPTSETEPLIDEIAACLREWHSTNLHELLLSRQYERLDQLSQLITGLNQHRQQLLFDVLTTYEYNQLRERTVWDLVTVNKLCGGEVIVRDPRANGRIMTGDDSAVEVTQLQSVMTLLDEPPQLAPEPTTLYHILLDVKAFAGSSTEENTLVFSLVNKSKYHNLASVSEAFSVDITAEGMIGGNDQNIQTKTLFTDLSPPDVGDPPSSESELYLVVKVLSSQQILSGKPLSRSGTGGHVTSPTSPTSSMGRAPRKSIVWGGRSSRGSLPKGSTGTGKADTDRTSIEGPPGTSLSGKAGVSHGVQVAQRTVGVGVLKLNSLVKHEEEAEHLINIWSRSSKAAGERVVSDDWDPVIRDIMDTPMDHYEKSKRGERLQINLRAFSHPDADELIKSTPTMLSAVSQTARVGFSGAPSKPRSDIYLTINHAALAKQNLLSRYGGSASSMSNSILGANFQLTVEVRRSSGDRIENCLYSSSNTDGLSTFKTVAVERDEGWRQTIRLSLGAEEVSHSHVVFYLSDMPNPPFAVAYVPLWDQQAFVRDGPHALLLYRIDEYTSTALPGPVGKGGYLSLPWGPRGRDERSAEVTGPLAMLAVETFLCSTKFSQNRVVLGLLRWKESSRDDVSAILRQLVFVPEIEVVKLLNDVLDCLFGILVEYSGNDEYEDLVFTALVKVLGIVHDRRFNLGPLVDQYAESQFNYPFATTCLVRSFTRLLENPTEPETARKLRATFKVVRHILKFITQSRGQQRAKEAGIGITSSTQSFSRHLRTIFKALDDMMRNSAPVLVGSQTLAVQHFHTWLPELSGLLTTEEILHIAIDFMDSCTNVKGKLILYKLILIINYSKLDLFAHPDQKAALSTNTVRWITPHWGHAEEINDQWREQVRLCCSVLASQMDHLAAEIPDHVPKIIDSYLAVLAVPQKPRNRISLLFPSSYPFPTKPIANELAHDEALAELAAVLSAMSTTPAGLQLEMADEDLSVVLENLLLVHHSILSGEAFPSDWLSVHIYHHKATMRTLEYIASIMLESFLPDPDDAESFNTELWKLLFTTLLKLVSSPSLAMETFPEQKRRAVWKIAGDVREHGAELLRTTWEAIGWEASQEERSRYGLEKMGGYQVQYVPTLVSPIVELCLSVHGGLRKMAVEVLQTMIVSEWTLSEDLSAIQTETIDCLDNYFKSKPLTESIVQKFFVSELFERFEPLEEIPDEPLYAAMRELIGTVDEFLELLSAVHGGDSSNEASHLVDRLRLMEFLRDMQKEEIFIRYVHQLATFQAEARNYAEAGLALRLHADLYEWDPTKQLTVLSDPEFPAQTVFERKEKIYFDMIKYFEEGESWSNALTAYKELQTQYESNVFDFSKLARTQRAIATIYESIVKSEKTIPKYFKVVYKGTGFPTSIRDKEFVYEGTLHERGSGFTDRMHLQYPNAQIVTAADVDDVEGQFLVVSNITPHRDLAHQVFQRTRVPQVIREFLLSSHPQTFSVVTKRVTAGPVHDHYSEKVVFTTAEPFPTILRRSEIVENVELRLNAHETALERIVRKTQELSHFERRLADGDNDTAPILLEAVGSAVTTAESSVSCYRQLLPQPATEKESDTGSGSSEDDGDDDDDEEDQEEEEELEPQDMAIKMALVDHAMIIKKCLTLFSRSSNPLLSQRHADLQTLFESTFEPEIALFSPPQPPRDLLGAVSPTWRAPTHSREPSATPLNISNVMNGVKPEEATIVRPVSMKQRGQALSFLRGRKDSDSVPQSTPTNGDPTSPTATPHNRSFSKDASRRTSLFRGQSSDHSRSDVSQARGSSDKIVATEKPRQQQNGSETGNKEEEAPSLTKRSSVRKRLSMLKLGKKSSSNKSSGAMGSLDEE